MGQRYRRKSQKLVTSEQGWNVIRTIRGHAATGSRADFIKAARELAVDGTIDFRFGNPTAAAMLWEIVLEERERLIDTLLDSALVPGSPISPSLRDHLRGGDETY